MKTISAIMKSVNWLVAIFFTVLSLLWVGNVIDLGMIGGWATDLNNSGPTYRILLAIGTFYLILFNLL